MTLTQPLTQKSTAFTRNADIVAMMWSGQMTITAAQTLAGNQSPSHTATAVSPVRMFRAPARSRR